jgi:homoserine O-acetyltransferase
LYFYVGHVLSSLTPNPDPENLLVMIQTWQNGDVSMQEPYNGDFEKAMSSIKAKTLVLPAKTDLYFP